MESGAEVLYEISEPVAGRVSKEEIASKLKKDFGDIMEVVKETAESAYAGLQKIEKSAKPNEYEITFGLKFSGKADVVFVQAGCESLFQVTLRWIK
jgi:hypothetical protein